MSLLPKKEYSPLFDGGIHDIDIDSLETIFLEPFDKKHRRTKLIDDLKKFLALIESFGLPTEVWLDGSFATEKPEPGDVDIALFMQGSDLKKLSEEDHLRLGSILSKKEEAKVRYNCDIYFCDPENVNLRSYWRGWFSFTCSEEIKGIPRIWLNK